MGGPTCSIGPIGCRHRRCRAETAPIVGVHRNYAPDFVSRCAGCHWIEIVSIDGRRWCQRVRDNPRRPRWEWHGNTGSEIRWRAMGRVRAECMYHSNISLLGSGDMSGPDSEPWLDDKKLPDRAVCRRRQEHRKVHCWQACRREAGPAWSLERLGASALMWKLPHYDKAARTTIPSVIAPSPALPS